MDGWPSRTTIAAAAVYIALALALTYPLSVHPASTSVPASSDTYLYAWTLAWDAHAFVHQPLRIFDANIFFPYAHTLAYSENLIGAALLVAPIEYLTRNPLLALNVAALLTIPLCALGGFVLARRLALGVPAAFLCGLVYGFSPPRFLRFDQAHLTAVEWIPFCLAYLHTYTSDGRPRDLRIALAFLTLQVLTSGHGAVFLLFAIACLALYRVARGDRVDVRRGMRNTGVVGALLLVPAVLMLIPYRLVQLDVGLRRDLGDWTGAFASYLSSPTHVHEFVLHHLGGLGDYVDRTAQASLFPGYVPLALAIVAMWPRSPQRDAMRLFYALIALACAVLAVGPPYGPWRFLYWLPGLSFIRVPSRFTILGVLALGVVAAFGFERLTATMTARRKSIAAVVIGTLFLAESAAVPFEVVPNPIVVPAIDRWLGSRPKPFVVAEVPPDDPAIYMLHSMGHWQRTVHGYSGWVPGLTGEISSLLAQFPNPESLDRLAARGVTYIVVHSESYPPGDWPSVDAGIAQQPERLHLQHVEGAGRVYLLTVPHRASAQGPSSGPDTSTRTWQPSDR